MPSTFLTRRTFLVTLLMGLLTPAFSQQPEPAAAAARPFGTIVVASVQGDAYMTASGQPRTALQKGSVLSQEQTVVTGANAKVILVFSNGATINLAPNSELSIEQFIQDPFADAVRIGDLQAEPTTSNTALRLRKGGLISNVKTLNKTGKSTFSIRTPVGAAGVRGTTFRIQYLTAGNRASFALRMAEGLINFAIRPPSTRSFDVGARKQLVIAPITIDPNTEEVLQIPDNIQVTDVPASELADIADGINEINEAADGIIFTPNPLLNGQNNAAAGAPPVITATPATGASSAVSALASPPPVAPRSNPSPLFGVR